jgi:hypothetical protein
MSDKSSNKKQILFGKKYTQDLVQELKDLNDGKNTNV